MKYSTMLAIAFCGVLALAVTGCKYDDDEGAVVAPGTENALATDLPSEVDPSAVGQDVASDVQPVAVDTQAAANAQAEALKNADSVPLDQATGLPFDQDPNFMRCTDVDLAPVYFGFDAFTLQQTELAKIEASAQHLLSNPGRVVMIEGNCDERGSNEYNLSLGESRAVAIRDYLITLGVTADRIQTKSYGEEKPAVMGSGEAVWAKNRRGEFAVYQHK